MKNNFLERSSFFSYQHDFNLIVYEKDNIFRINHWSNANIIILLKAINYKISISSLINNMEFYICHAELYHNILRFTICRRVTSCLKN